MTETLIFVAGLLLGAFLSCVMVFGVGTGRRKSTTTRTVGALEMQTPGPDEMVDFVVDARTGEKHPFVRPVDKSKTTR